MDNPAIIFRDVWKSYPCYNHVTGGIKSFLFNLPTAVKELFVRHPSLKNVNLEILRGETFGFIGNNGAGKSTLLGLIAGVLFPDRGLVQVNGRVSPLLELGAGFHPELTGRDNIMLNGVLLGLTRVDVTTQLEEIIAFSGLESFIDQPVRTYSSGMLAKLGFSVVSILKPEILLLDEILAVGDIGFQAKCAEKIAEFRNNSDVTIVFVSHSLDEVSKFCDRVAWVDNKTIRMLGPATEVVKSYKDEICPELNKQPVGGVSIEGDTQDSSFTRGQ